MSESLLYISLAAIVTAVVLISLVPLVILKAAKDPDIELMSSGSDSLGFFLKALRPLLRAYSNVFSKKTKPETLDIIRLKLLRADLLFSLTPNEFIALRRLSLALTTGFGYLIIQILDMHDAPKIVAILGGMAVLGHIYPDIWLNDTIKQRRNQIEKAFPFLLDLLVLMMRAGLPFAGAIQQGINKIPEGPLKREFVRYQRDIRTGLARAQALENLSTRVDIPAITNFTAAIIQAEETGGSITNMLATQAKQRRKERFLRAEKKANEAPVKMLLPLVGLLFPITFMIISVPIIVQFLDSGLVEKLLK
ncbi:MAG: type II secretion system F family protein [Marinobacterium sp.]|uniref:Tight adherence protein C n=1 Tax=Marinobacterium iners DSM 11526 TaxID=1122198 RepID=A0A1H4GES6_9GAMM|nr:type II secretion system F family protein [Marinobacterium iners]SEB07520.1 tight adherence protein C [Marinobacterium iners DSM 11526]